jgi:uncharacterized protein YjbI with pentapeptide repeats
MGTSFKDANLTDANFQNAELTSTDFRQKELNSGNLNRTCWQGSKSLDYARFGNTILDERTVRELLRTGEGMHRSYQGCNLKGAYLVGADLTEADLSESDISKATLEGAVLSGANFKKTQALGSNFYKAVLTGACLEAWNIDTTTQLKGSICDYIYLLSAKQEKCPSSGNFQYDEFGRLFQKVLSTVDFIFRNGVDWQAFDTAFKQVRIENQDTELEIQSIERKGNDVVVVKVNVPPNTDKQKIHSSLSLYYKTEIVKLKAYYNERLLGKEEEIGYLYQQNISNTNLM